MKGLCLFILLSFAVSSLKARQKRFAGYGAGGAGGAGAGCGGTSQWQPEYPQQNYPYQQGSNGQVGYPNSYPNQQQPYPGQYSRQYPGQYGQNPQNYPGSQPQPDWQYGNDNPSQVDDYVPPQTWSDIDQHKEKNDEEEKKPKAPLVISG